MFQALVIVGVILILILAVLGTWRKAPQDKAIIITGFRKKVITGGGGILIPLVERMDVMSLESIKFEVITRGALTKQGVPIKVGGVAVIKVGSQKEHILAAAERFYKGSEEETIEAIKELGVEILEGKLREIISEMSVETIYQDRKEFGTSVQTVAVPELVKMGLALETLTIKDIDDDEGYLKALGRKQIAEVKKTAEIAEAEARRDSKVSIAVADREGEAARLKAETEIAEAEKDKTLKVQEYKKVQESAKAEAELAYVLKQNAIQQEVKREEIKIELVKKEEEIRVAAQEALRKEQELAATIRKTAEAQRYEIEQKAEAEKYRQIQQAVAEAEAIKARGLAEAEAIRLRGNAEAESIKAKALAEAEGMSKKAEAWKQYNEAAVTQLKVEVLPEIARAIAEPLMKVERITVVDSGSGAGASRIPGYVADLMAKLPEVVETLTGKTITENVSELRETANSKGTY